MSTILEADGVWLEYSGRRILNNIYIRAQVGQVTGILGRNGCGKSSLLQIIFGSRSAQNSSVRIDGKTSLTSLYKRRSCVAYLSQETFIPTSLAVRDVLRLYGVSIDTVLTDFPVLEAVLTQKMGHLSGGQQRLVEVVATVYAPRTFILLDEPFLQIAPVQVEQLMAVIEREKQHKAFLLTDHLYRKILSVSDELYMLRNGKTYRVHDPAELEWFGYLPE